MWKKDMTVIETAILKIIDESETPVSDSHIRKCLLQLDCPKITKADLVYGSCMHHTTTYEPPDRLNSILNEMEISAKIKIAHYKGATPFYVRRHGRRTGSDIRAAILENLEPLHGHTIGWRWLSQIRYDIVASLKPASAPIDDLDLSDGVLETVLNLMTVDDVLEKQYDAGDPEPSYRIKSVVKKAA